MSGLQIVGLISLSVGACGVLFYSLKLLQRRRLLRNAVKVTGKITRLETVGARSEYSEPALIPWVEFKAKDGQTRERPLPATHDSQSHEVGTKVKLLYQCDNPDNVTDTESRWQDLMTHLVMSLILLAFGGMLYFGLATVPQ